MLCSGMTARSCVLLSGCMSAPGRCQRYRSAAGAAWGFLCRRPLPSHTTSLQHGPARTSPGACACFSGGMTHTALGVDGRGGTVPVGWPRGGLLAAPACSMSSVCVHSQAWVGFSHARALLSNCVCMCCHTLSLGLAAWSHCVSVCLLPPAGSHPSQRRMRRGQLLLLLLDSCSWAVKTVSSQQSPQTGTVTGSLPATRRGMGRGSSSSSRGTGPPSQGRQQQQQAAAAALQQQECCRGTGRSRKWRGAPAAAGGCQHCSSGLALVCVGGGVVGRVMAAGLLCWPVRCIATPELAMCGFVCCVSIVVA